MRLCAKGLTLPLLMLAVVATPLVSAPESATPSPDATEVKKVKKVKEVKETGHTDAVAEPGVSGEAAKGPVQHPPGPAPVPVTPKAVTTVVVPSIVSQPPARYHVAPRQRALGGPQPAEVPTPKRIQPRSKGIVDPELTTQQLTAPATFMTPPLSVSFDSLDFDSNLTHSGFVFTPPDANGAAGPGHVVSVTNVSLSFHDKVTGVVTFEDSLAGFFATLSPLTFTFDPKVIYDQFAGRFVIVTLESTDVANGAAADTSRLLVAVSDDADPNGTWSVTEVDASEVFVNPFIPPAGASADHLVDFPGFAIDEEVVYVTGNMFAFGSGFFGGVRLWVIDKGLGSGGFYDGGAASVSQFDPYAGCGPGVDCFEITTQPAHIFGTAPSAPTNVGTWLVSYSGLSDGLGAGLDEAVQVVRIDDPIGPGVTTFTHEFVNVGDIEDPFAASLPEAEQLDSTDTIATNSREALQAVWRDNDQLYFSATILPEPPDPDAGQATAHWFQVDTAPLVGISLTDQGNVGGEDIHASGAVHTFFPSISVNVDNTVALGFSASSASIYAGSYYATRKSSNPPGTFGPSLTLRAGVAPYLRTFCSGGNRWGDYSGMSVDPVDQCFWAYNQHAAATGSPTTAPCQTTGHEVGRWATAFGSFCGTVCGDGTVDADETCDPPGASAGANGNECRADCTVCGDLVVDPAEDCDDGNTVDTDACRNDCTAPVCGDDIIDSGETCDPPGQPAGAIGNDCRADCTVCGDNILDGDEECDDGNASNVDTCRNNCRVPGCGDGTVDPGEDCDDGNTTDGDGCEADCTPTPTCGDGQINVEGETCDPPGQPAGVNGNDCRDDCRVCGDSIVDPGEDCDDANSDDFDSCRNNCTAPRCGDGIVDSGETCDPPGQPAGAVGNDCRGDCTVCGDGIVDPGEECDDNNAMNVDSCHNDCREPACGDDVLDPGEVCDDGNTVDGDGCEGDCTPTPICGDSQLNVAGETCDPPDEPAGVNGNDCREDCTVCGDGVSDPSEDCDDGNTEDADGCRNDCTVPVCGDGIIDSGETCDPPGEPGGAISNDCRFDCTVCGDSVVDAPEDCDDGNAFNFDTCRNNCLAPVCGDGIVDPAEDCDDGNMVAGDGCENDCTETPICGDGSVDAPDETCDPPGQPAGANGNDCRVDCTVCGDGVVDTGEECDDGNADDTDSCRNNCLLARCGDGIVGGPGETCDPPGQPAGANGNECRVDCTVCGDNVVDANEDCDDGNASNSDACRNDCNAPFCGDGIVDPGEVCDDGNTAGGDGCENDCTETPICGDGTVNAPGETCEPPGQPAGASGRDCRPDCTVCGDGIVDAGEECDDGNADHGDSCRNSCLLPRCGDGIVDAPDETCDPPGQPAGPIGDLCRVDCTVCGDGVVNADEECDDGNAVSFDSCRNNCTAPFCGDSIVDPTEDCDDGNTTPGDGCEIDCTETPVCGDGLVSGASETCEPPGSPAGPSDNLCRADCTVCGDGIVDSAEECDDANADSFDLCRNDCTVPACGDGILDLTTEECDDGNTADADGCEANCTFTPAGTLTSLLLDRNANDSEITLTWGPSCFAGDRDYAIYEGQLTNFTTHVPETCSTGGSQTATFERAFFSSYYLVVPHNANFEGSYGRDSEGSERSGSMAACEPQRIGVCL